MRWTPDPGSPESETLLRATNPGNRYRNPLATGLAPACSVSRWSPERCLHRNNSRMRGFPSRKGISSCQSDSPYRPRAHQPLRAPSPPSGRGGSREERTSHSNCPSEGSRSPWRPWDRGSPRSRLGGSKREAIRGTSPARDGDRWKRTEATRTCARNQPRGLLPPEPTAREPDPRGGPAKQEEKPKGATSRRRWQHRRLATDSISGEKPWS